MGAAPLGEIGLVRMNAIVVRFCATAVHVFPENVRFLSS
jgi:hypothetical protein